MPVLFPHAHTPFLCCVPFLACLTTCPTLQATEALRITAPELVKFGVMDEIVPEPLGGSHADPATAFPIIKEALLRNFEM